MIDSRGILLENFSTCAPNIDSYDWFKAESGHPTLIEMSQWITEMLYPIRVICKNYETKPNLTSDGIPAVNLKLRFLPRYAHLGTQLDALTVYLFFEWVGVLVLGLKVLDSPGVDNKGVFLPLST